MAKITIKINNKDLIKGEYKWHKLRPLIGLNADNKLKAFQMGLYKDRVIESSPVISNLVMSSDGLGINQIIRHLAGVVDTVPVNQSPLRILYAGVGTGDTAPNIADTELETPVLQNIVRATAVIDSPNVLVTEWFIASDNLPNDTYNEFGLYTGAFEDERLFVRTIISPALVKGTDTDVVFEHTLTITNNV